MKSKKSVPLLIWVVGFSSSEGQINDFGTRSNTYNLISKYTFLRDANSFLICVLFHQKTSCFMSCVFFCLLFSSLYIYVCWIFPPMTSLSKWIKEEKSQRQAEWKDCDRRGRMMCRTMIPHIQKCHKGNATRWTPNDSKFYIIF